MARDRLLAAAAVCAVVVGTAATAHGGVGSPRVALPSRAIELFQSAPVGATGLRARRAEVRLLGATDRTGLAYEWKPYGWRRLRLVHGSWHGRLPAPALPGVYQAQLRLDGGRTLASRRWLLRVFPPGTMARPSSPTDVAAVRGYVARLPGHEVLAALRRWPQAGFDRRDPRLLRIFVIAYAPRGQRDPSARLGLFVTTFRNGFQGRWRVLQATTQPYD